MAVDFIWTSLKHSPALHIVDSLYTSLVHMQGLCNNHYNPVNYVPMESLMAHLEPVMSQ